MARRGAREGGGERGGGGRGGSGGRGAGGGERKRMGLTSGAAVLLRYCRDLYSTYCSDSCPDLRQDWKKGCSVRKTPSTQQLPGSGEVSEKGSKSSVLQHSPPLEGSKSKVPSSFYKNIYICQIRQYK